MSTTWVYKYGLVVLGLLSVGVLLAGCKANGLSLPLYLYVEPAPDSPDQEIIVTLDNPTKSQLFVPEAWTGLAVYQKTPTGGWSERIYPGGFQTMVQTWERKILYLIPEGILEPGSYRIVLQGRVGGKGTPFFLETRLDLSSSPPGADLS